ncbi:sulfotransferase 1C4-like [Leguminivora glycinivorella]|uniref:sulfotransferase 1C4-like n=1 Tax=Leguminivora glycinivorella TaxID=1035111 RepID=UPI0020108827|nr:sulfotransferase 1C4-like [Leguminivora glycinivorella]
MDDKVKVQDVDPQSSWLLKRHFNHNAKYARFGDAGSCQLMAYKEDAENFKNMVIRPDDVWVATFPRSGTTWTQEIVWLLMNNFDFDKATKTPLHNRYMFLEIQHTRCPETVQNMDPEILKKAMEYVKTYEDAVAAPSPRFFKTHLPFSLLPSNLVDTAKVVYVARDPRDVAVSYYHHTKLFWKYTGDFKSYWNLFLNDLVIWAPFLPHVKEAWALRHHPNLLFIFYEDMRRDLPSNVKLIADFLGKEATEEQIMKLCDHVDIKNFKKNESVNPSWMTKMNGTVENNNNFIREGKTGGWREHFDEEMTAQAERWLRENLADSDLRFPEV